jgi:hypothetical protein
MVFAKQIKLSNGYFLNNWLPAVFPQGNPAVAAGATRNNIPSMGGRFKICGSSFEKRNCLIDFSRTLWIYTASRKDILRSLRRRFNIRIADAEKSKKGRLCRQENKKDICAVW